MQTRSEESCADDWPWASDVTRAVVCLIVGLLVVLAPAPSQHSPIPRIPAGGTLLGLATTAISLSQWLYSGGARP
jgi:hypothetical protein